MKIGILSLSYGYNYGGLLQGYALQTVLERMGYQVEYFHTDADNILDWKKLILHWAYRFIKKWVLKQDTVPVFAELKIKKLNPIIGKELVRFANIYIHTKEVKKLENLNGKDYGAIVVGSDQVWRPMFFNFRGGIANAYLAFAKAWNIKRIAFAASFGVDYWEYSNKQTQVCKKLAQYFNAISVREESGKTMCQKYLGVKAKLVLDPTLLLSQKEYEKIIDLGCTHKCEGDLLCYILDETSEKQQIVKSLSQQKGYKPFTVLAKNRNITAPIDDQMMPSMEQWLRGFKEASFIVTDSFHACVFSIIFRKNFVVIGNKKRGIARIESLLKMFELEERLVERYEEVDALVPIQYEKVYRRLELLKKDSLDFLQNNL